MTDLLTKAPRREASADFPTVEEAAEHLLRVLPPMFKRMMGEARMQIPGDPHIGETQFRIIHALNHRDFTVGEMADKMQVRTPTISRMMDSLVERGYVDRQSDPDDRRKVCMRLTAAGQELARGAEESFCHAVARFLQPLDGQDLALVVAACDTLETLLTNDRPTESKV